MANRNFNNVQALERGTKHLFANISIGTSGAPTLVSGLGVADIERNAAGDYTLTLEDAYNKLLHFDGIVENTSGEDINFQVDEVDLSNSAKTISFYTVTGGSATDPADEDVIRLFIAVRNSSVGPA